MTQWIHYEHAPITEAMLEIGVGLEEGFELAALATAFDSNPDFTRQALQVGFRATFTSGNAAGASAIQEPHGFGFVSKDGRRFAQATLNSFSFSWLAPYSDWGEFQQQAKGLWEAYRVAASPTSIQRMSLRYINRLELPERNLNRYLRLPLLVPDVGPLAQADAMVAQIRVPWPDDGATLAVTEAVPTLEGEKATVILDIAIFREGEAQGTDEDLWKAVDRFHEIKNEVFEALITDDLRELIR